jgi:hypothetical protein
MEEFINEEETLKAIKLALKAPKKPEEKKKKDQPQLAYPNSSRKRFNDYNFTPLNLRSIDGDKERLGLPKASKDTRSPSKLELE